MNALHKKIWINCTCLILSEINQTQNKTCCLIPVILGSKTNKTDLWCWKSAWWLLLGCLLGWYCLGENLKESSLVVELFYYIFDAGGNYKGV